MFTRFLIRRCLTEPVTNAILCHNSAHTYSIRHAISIRQAYKQQEEKKNKNGRYMESHCEWCLQRIYYYHYYYYEWIECLMSTCDFMRVHGHVTFRVFLSDFFRFHFVFRAFFSLSHDVCCCLPSGACAAPRCRFPLTDVINVALHWCHCVP